MAGNLPELTRDYLIAQEAAGQYSVAIAPEYRITPISDIKQLNTLSVSVYDGPRRSERASRGAWQHTETTYVTIQEKIERHTDTGVIRANELKVLLREIERDFEEFGEEDVLDGWQFDSFDEAVPRLPFSLEEMNATGVYSAVVGLVFISFSDE